MTNKSLEGTQTKENLETALHGEALAHLKYQFYRSKLVDFNKGYETILDEIIHNEKEHGKIWFKLLHDGGVPDNETNLLDAIEGETYEAEQMYQEFGDTAHEEGFNDIAELFYQVAEIESNHALTFETMKITVDDDKYLYKSFDDNDELFKCLNCGHIVKGKEAPKECPVCKHPQKYFTRL
jgi:rubrerythrin